MLEFHLLISLLQSAYILATSCTLEEHSKRPDRKSSLSLAKAFVKKASAAMEAAVQLPTPPTEVQIARKTLHTLVCPCLSDDVTTSEIYSGRIGQNRGIFPVPLEPAMRVPSSTNFWLQRHFMHWSRDCSSWQSCELEKHVHVVALS